MGPSHAISGALVGVGVCVALAHVGAALTPASAAAVIAGVTVGSLVPDLDSPNSLLSTALSPTALAAKAARRWAGKVRRRRRADWVERFVAKAVSGWRPTPLVSRAVRALSALAFRVTTTRYDDRQDPGGRPAGTHRYLTHTLAWAAAVGVVLTAAAVTVKVLWWPSLWWWIGLPVAAGCVVHLWGDWITVMGVPLLWPLTARGKRWYRWRSPPVPMLQLVEVDGRRWRRPRVVMARLHAGSVVEKRLVAPLMALALVWVAGYGLATA